MALPIIRAAGATAKVAGSKALQGASNLARSTFVDPFKSAIAQTGIGQVTDVIKEIRAEAAAMKGDVSTPTVDTSTMENELESIDDRNESQVSLLQQLLAAINFGNEMFQDQMTDAAAKRALAGRAKREADIEAAAAQGIELPEGQEEKSKGIFGSIFGGITDKLKLLLNPKVLALGSVIALLSTNFEKFKEVFGGLKDIVESVIKGDMTMEEGLKASVELLRTKVVDAIKIEVENMFAPIINFFETLPLKVGQFIDEQIQRLPKFMRDAMGIQTASEIKAQAASARQQALSASTLSVDEQRELGVSPLDMVPTVAQQQLEQVESGVPDLGINVEALSDRDRAIYNRQLEMFKRTGDRADFERRVQRFIPQQVTGTTGQIADESGAAAAATAAPIINNFIDQRSVVTDQSRKSFAATHQNKPAAGIR